MEYTYENIKKDVQPLVKKTIQSHYMPEYQDGVDEAQAMGVLISKYFEWDGIEIMKAFASALEDSNFHSESSKVLKMIEKYNK